MKKVQVWDESETLHELTLPYDDWVVDVKHKGYEAWAHSPDGRSGVSAYGKSGREAIRNLKDRIDAWITWRANLQCSNPKHPFDGADCEDR